MKVGTEHLTYRDIARKTGLSVSTISRVITGSARVSGEASRRVFDFLEKNRYDAALLRSKKAQAGGVIIFNVPSMDNPFYSQVCSGARAAALNYGYHMLIHEEHINNNTIDSLAALIKRVRAAGLLIANAVPEMLLKKLAAAVPLVQCCEYDEKLPLPYVSIDDIGAAKTVMDYLFARGKKRIALVNGPIRYKYARHRLQGYQEALETAGIPPDPNLVLQLPEISYDMAVSEAVRFFRQGLRADAFFCACDVYAAAVIKAGKRFDLRVPGDFSVVGFDNLEIAAITYPALTTVNQPKYQLGLSGCELLVERLSNPLAPVRSILLETELIVRESSA